jgi:S-adenosylmethionine-diacylgycerolhomoserine-N-methlytransferase
MPTALVLTQAFIWVLSNSFYGYIIFTTSTKVFTLSKLYIFVNQFFTNFYFAKIMDKIIQINEKTIGEQAQKMGLYYRFHAPIYDATRWTFLFGRNTILKQLPFERSQNIKILEVGCGTGSNMRQLHAIFPNAKLTGIDVSRDMLQRAAENLRALPTPQYCLLHRPYTLGDTDFNQKFDVILFSYSLTMINPHWGDLLKQATYDLAPNGVIAIADFHTTHFGWFRAHMRRNHVRMEAHILPQLTQLFTPQYLHIGKAYGGLWEYFGFIGSKKK